jgi:hypothetical protein
MIIHHALHTRLWFFVFVLHKETRKQINQLDLGMERTRRIGFRSEEEADFEVEIR